MKKFLLAAAALCALTSATSAMAQSTELGFESGTLNGWTTNGGGAGVTTSLTNGVGTTVTPAQGSFFAFIQAGLGANVYTTLSRDFLLGAGQTLAGSVGYLANDYAPFNDDAYLTVGGTTLFSSGVLAVGNYGTTGFVPFSFTAPTAGTYTLQLGVRNTLDNAASSYAVLDASATGAVPEPATWGLMILGFGAAGFALRRRGQLRTSVRFA